MGIDGLESQNVDCVDSYFLAYEDPLLFEQEITSWPSKGKLCGIVFAPHFVDDVWGAGVCSDKKEGDSGKYSCHIGDVAREQHWFAAHLPVCIKIKHHCI
jgi:hypothetical protein